MQFLRQLQRNNKREWFQKNKSRYEAELREPCLAFIRAIQLPLKKISANFVASDRRSGGSLMRIYRDTRFSKNKSPYKTNVGIQFRHAMGGDVHAPGFYVHFEPGECFLGAGVWHPDSESLGRIRQAIDSDPSIWKRARDNKKFRAVFDLVGESLKSAPRGYDKDHPLIDDLKRKEHIGVKSLTDADILKPDFLESVVTSFSASKAYTKFLCEALKIPF